MSIPTSINNQPRLFIGFLLNIGFYADLVRRRLGHNLQYVNLGETVRQMLHMYFYAENLPTLHPHDTYLGATAVYSCNQNALSNEVRGAILTTLSETQWDLHDYINTAIQYPLTRNVANEREYYYTVDTTGKLMVYVPIPAEVRNTVHGLPEAAIVMACFNTLPMEKRVAFGPAFVQMSGQQNLQPVAA